MELEINAESVWGPYWNTVSIFTLDVIRILNFGCFYGQVGFAGEGGAGICIEQTKLA